MKTIYQIRGVICRFFMQYELIVKVLLKFCAYLFIFRQIAGWDGFSSAGVLNAFSVHMLLALLCVLLPSRFAVFFSFGIIIYNIYQVSLWGALMAAVILLVLYVMVARLCPDETILVILLPLAMKWNIFMVVPLFAGLYMGVFSIIPLVGGVLIWGILRILPAFLSFNETELEQLPAALSDTANYIIDQLIRNENLIFMMVLCIGVVLVIYLLNKINMNYMRYISLAVGAMVGLVCLIVGRVVGMTDMGILSALFVPVLSLAVMVVVEFFHMALNYKMAQRLTFADDEYYYYVQAVPKILGIRNKTEVKKITGHTEPIEPVAQEAAEPVAESEAEPVMQSSPITEQIMHTTQKIGELFTQMGDKAKGLWGQIKEKQAQNEMKKQAERQKEEGQELSREEFMTEEMMSGQEVNSAAPARQDAEQEPDVSDDQDSFFAEQIPTSDSVEELAKRTGWSDETIKDFFAGLDLDIKEAEDDKDPNKQ
ncbi:MAG: hypothetical protein ACLU6B_07220 [Lachnospirales bacterium]